MKIFTSYIVLALVCALPIVLLAQTTVSMPVNVAGAVYTVTPSGVTPLVGTITVSSPVGSAYTYSLDGGTYQAGTTFNGLAGGSSHTITVKTTANNTLSTTPAIVVPLCDNDISTGTGVIARMLYDNTGSGTASYNWCAREVTGPDGLQWLDRNLGAYQVATSSTDALSYGSLYEWGRNSDGHQIAGGTRGVDATTASPTTTTLATSDVPGNGTFISNTNPGIRDWRSDNNNNRWNLTSGTGATFTQDNNPCPDGYHVPINAQLNAVSSSWSNAASAYSSTLKMPIVGGFRLSNSVANLGISNYYWSSTPLSSNTYSLGLVNGSIVQSSNSFRADGFSVRCIKN